MEKVLFTQERHGLKLEIVERDGPSSRIVRVRGAGVDLTPEQCDVIGTLGSLAHARANVLAKLQEKSDAHNG